MSEVVSLAGIELKNSASSLFHERNLGIRTRMRSSETFIKRADPGSPAGIGGLIKDDEIIAVDGFKVESNLSDLVENSKIKEIELTVFSNKKLKTIQLLKTDQRYYDKFSFHASTELTSAQLHFRNHWLKR